MPPALGLIILECPNPLNDRPEFCVVRDNQVIGRSIARVVVDAAERVVTGMEPVVEIIERLVLPPALSVGFGSGLHPFLTRWRHGLSARVCRRTVSRSTGGNPSVFP